MSSDFGEFTIIQSRPAKLLVVEIEAQPADKVQSYTRVGTKANDVARVRRNFGLEKNDGEHRPIIKV